MNTSMEIFDNHMRHALKDVTNMQLDLGKFKQKIDTEVHTHTEANNQKFAQSRLTIKQAQDLLYDL